MSKFEEIEIKWNAERVLRKDFNRAIKKLLAGDGRYRKNWCIKVAGFDYYYTSKDGYVIRHRAGPKTNELTVKARLSKRSTTIRRETNMKLVRDVSPLVVKEAMSDIGFDKVMPIYKDCDIYFVRDGGYVVDIVWYRASNAKKALNLIEVEVHDAPRAVSLRILNRWKKFVRSLGLTDRDILNDSLYEIFSGKRYRMKR